MYPEIWSWGVLHIRTYGLMLAVAFLVGTWLGLKEARRHGLDEDRFLTVVIVTLISSVLGARLLFVLEHADEFRRSLPTVLAVWQGGLTLYGGLVAGTVGGLWMAKRQRLSPWLVADSLAPSVALGTTFGRVGCFLNGCCYGRPTKMPWGIVYPRDTFPSLEFGATPIHPSQLYFSAAALGLFFLLWAVRKRLRVPGHVFWLFVALYALIRIPLDFTRAYEPGSMIGRIGVVEVTESQAMSVVLALFALLMMIRLGRDAQEASRRVPAPAASQTRPSTPAPEPPDSLPPAPAQP